jgi:hypothetical protein
MTKRCVLAATVGAVILSALLTAGHLRLSVWSGLLAHAFLWGGIVLIVIAYQRRRTAGVALGISLSSAALCSIIAFMVADTVTMIRACKVGDVVASALFQFRADKGRYPEELEELRPRYLNSIPKPDIRGVRTPRFWYERSENRDFVLWFERSGYRQCRRNAEAKWVCYSD